MLFLPVVKQLLFVAGGCERSEHGTGGVLSIQAWSNLGPGRCPCHGTETFGAPFPAKPVLSLWGLTPDPAPCSCGCARDNICKNKGEMEQIQNVPWLKLGDKVTARSSGVGIWGALHKKRLPGAGPTDPMVQELGFL